MLTLPLDTLVAFALFALVGSVTPGPNNLMVTASGANFGFRRTIPHMLGISLGFAAMVIVVGFGLGAVLTAAPNVVIGLKIAGVLYTLWLAWKIARAAGLGAAEGGGRPMTFFEGALFQWVNVKAWALIIGALSLYAAGGGMGAVLTIAVVFTLINIPSVGVWAAFGVGLRRFLSSPARLRAFNVTMAGLLLLSVIPVLI